MDTVVLANCLSFLVLWVPEKLTTNCCLEETADGNACVASFKLKSLEIFWMQILFVWIEEDLNSVFLIT